MSGTPVGAPQAPEPHEPQDTPETGSRAPAASAAEAPAGSEAPAEQSDRAGRPDRPEGSGRRTSRRTIFTSAGLGAALAGLAGVAGGRAWVASRPAEDTILTVYPFRGERQAGITTPAQDNMFSAAFDVSTTDVEVLKDLLTQWTVAAEQMCAGELIGGEPSANK